MPLSGAERARLYRLRKRENEAEYSSYLQKERNRYQKRKDKGDIKLVADMTEREKRSARRMWKLRKQNERNRNRVSTMELNTPPHSPGPFPIQMNLTRGRQRVRRDRSKAYREIAKLKQTVDNQRRTIEKYRKRLYRRSQRTKDLDSPRTKTASMLRGQRVSMPVKKTLLFHHVLVKGVTEKYKLMKSERSKQLIAQDFCNKLLKKYRMKKATKQHLNMTQRRIKEPISSDVGYVQKPRKIDIIERLKSDIEQFLCRNDNSRLKAGKKSTKTSAKVKKQIYLLNDTLRNLHLKYLAEDTSRRLSYSLFCRLKPFYIRHATAADRETCLC